MELNLEEFVRDIKKYDAGEVRVEFDFVHEGERYKANIAVKRFGEEQTEGFCAVDEMIEEEEQEDDKNENQADDLQA